MAKSKPDPQRQPPPEPAERAINQQQRGQTIDEHYAPRPIPHPPAPPPPKEKKR